MLTQMTNRVPVLIKTLIDRKLDATELLTQDHLKVESLFMQLKFLNQIPERLKARRPDIKKRREAIWDQIHTELSQHASAEESVFYAECEKHEDLKPLINESFEEHKQIKTLLKAMNELSIDNEHFEAKLTVLIENVAHHVREEEEDLFPQVRKTISRSKLEKLAGQIRTAKKKGRKTALAA
jgi:iron-sulfur cluster repair protein YtfE (RIC family)